MRHTPTLVLMLALSSTPAIAQTGATRPPVPQHQILSANPFGLLFNWFNVEYERKIAPATTLGASASHVSGLDYSNAALLLRWYPQGAALDGFYLGARAGAYGFETYDYEYPAPATGSGRGASPIIHRRTEVQPGVGIEVGYNWLLGPRQNVTIGLGFGLTRLLGSGRRSEDLPVLPNPRVVNIGIAF